MINLQLNDFIKQQLDQGVTKEKISSDLRANGWTIEDVEDGFKSVQPSAPMVKPASAFNLKVILIIFGVIILLVGGALAYYFRNDLVNLPMLGSLFIYK